MPCHPVAESIGFGKRTEGTETSQYLQEEKARAISSVAASERETAQTGTHVKPACVVRPGLWDSISLVRGPSGGVINYRASRMVLGKPTTEGDSPVGESTVAPFD